MPTTHAKVSAKADIADATQVLPSDWNADHVGGPDNITDDDGDTKIQAEEAADEDKLRFDCGIEGEKGLLSETATETYFKVNSHEDKDGDTKIQVEEGADDDHIRMDVKGVEAFVLDDAGILTLDKQSRLRAHNRLSQTIETGVWTKIAYNVAGYDEQSEFQVEADDGITTGAAGGKLIQAGQNFLTTVAVEDIVHNETDGTFTRVTAVDSDIQLSVVLATPNGKTYTIYRSRYTGTVPGTYIITSCQAIGAVDAKISILGIYKNGAFFELSSLHGSYVGDLTPSIGGTAILNGTTDYLEIFVYQDSGAQKTLGNTDGVNNVEITKVA